MLLPLLNVHGPKVLVRELIEKFRDRLTVTDGLGAVSVVGAGINRDASNLRRTLAAVEGLGVRPEGVHTSSFRISIVVARERVADCVRRLHEEVA